MDDIIVLATIPIEFLQLASLGPDFESFFKTLANISDAFAMDIE